MISISQSFTTDPHDILIDYARHPEKLAAVVQTLGDGQEIDTLVSQLKALSVADDNQSPLMLQPRLQLVQKVVNASIIIRQHRTLQSQMAQLTLHSKKVLAETRARVLEDQTHLQQDQVAHDNAIEQRTESIAVTHLATQEIGQSRIQIQQQDIARTNKNLDKAEQEIQNQEERQQALLAQTRNLSSALGNY